MGNNTLYIIVTDQPRGLVGMFLTTTMNSKQVVIIYKLGGAQALQFCTQIPTASPIFLNLNWILQVPKDIFYVWPWGCVLAEAFHGDSNCCFQGFMSKCPPDVRSISSRNRVGDSAKLLSTCQVRTLIVEALPWMNAKQMLLRKEGLK